MAGSLRRRELQAAAQAKIDDSSLLLQNGRYANAFYLAGYAIELGLKACISRQISAEAIPDRNLIREIFSHDFKRLVALAGLTAALRSQETANTNFAANWGFAAQWSPDSRYEGTDSYTAQLMVEAVADPNDGVLQWIKAHW